MPQCKSCLLYSGQLEDEANAHSTMVASLVMEKGRCEKELERLNEEFVQVCKTNLLTKSTVNVHILATFKTK